MIMIHLKKYILTLVALLAVTTQAWAGDTYKIVTTMTFNTWPPNNPIVKEAAASLPYTKKLIDWVETGENNAESIRNINVTGENIAKGTGTGWNTEITVNGAGTGNISFDLVSNSYSVTVTVTKNPTATPIPVAWDADTKTGTIAAMPAGNVIVNAEYYQDAAFAMSTGTTPVALAPTANNSAKANTDDPLVTGGEVANIVEGTEALEAKQGTLMYYFDRDKATTKMTAAQLEALTADEWSDKVPTADGLHFDAATDVFVYYYIKGADDVAGLADGVKHTFSDSDPVCLTVSVQKETTFKVELNAEGLTTAEAANWKAAKGSATPAAFPLTGVKKDDNVTVTYTGSRKVIGLKAEKIITIVGDGATVPATTTTTLNITGCTTWAQIIEKNSNIIETEGNFIFIKDEIIRLAYKFNYGLVSKDADFDPNVEYLWVNIEN